MFILRGSCSHDKQIFLNALVIGVSFFRENSLGDILHHVDATLPLRVDIHPFHLLYRRIYLRQVFFLSAFYIILNSIDPFPLKGLRIEEII